MHGSEELLMESDDSDVPELNLPIIFHNKNSNALFK